MDEHHVPLPGILDGVQHAPVCGVDEIKQLPLVCQ
jgi:hypothetical protein